MGNTVHVRTHLVEVVQVQLAQCEAFFVRTLGDDVTPRVNNHGVAEAKFGELSRLTALSCCDNITLILNCSSSQ